MSSRNEAVLNCFTQTAGLQAELHSKLALPALFLSSPQKEVTLSVGPLSSFVILMCMVNLNTYVYFATILRSATLSKNLCL